ncbi:MAG: putative sulfate/molybdate transporter [Phycisphaerae bacterium]|nr:putative sulfate/molybdate transporter [Phycisphaerae bacterium]
MIIVEEHSREPRVRFDRNELAGSFGDVGTDLPLIVAMIAAAGLDGSTVFVIFGLLQILTGIVYGVPMPMQPLKAMAVLVITQRIGADTLLGGGFAIAIIMLTLSLTGALTWLAHVIPRSAVRGVQFGLGLSLASLALKDYVPSLGVSGFILAAVCFVLVVLLWGNRRFPAALPVIGLGLIYACVVTIDWSAVTFPGTMHLPTPRMPSTESIWTGLFLLALPQLPLSLSNAVIATHQTLHDLFPERSVTMRRIGITYGVANVCASIFGGIPVCHGCGGLAGHHAFGARTGGSVVIYGSIYVALGLLLGDAVGSFAAAYPRPVLGVILLFEAVGLMRLISDQAGDRRQMTVALFVGALAFGLPQGFMIGLIVGTGIWYFWRCGVDPSTTKPG